jgi:hypothetical protein
MTSQSAIQANHAIGALFLFLFGAVWLAGWCLHPTAQHLSSLWLIVPICIAMCALAVRQFRRNITAYRAEAKLPAGKRSNRVLGIVNGVQWLCIFAAAVFLQAFGYSQWFVACVILIVGLHFIPLAAALRYPPYYYTAVALVALAVLFPLLSAAGPKSSVGLLGAGVILWVTALGLLAGRSQQ